MPAEKKLDQLAKPYVSGVMMMAWVPILPGGLDWGFNYLDRVVGRNVCPGLLGTVAIGFGFFSNIIGTVIKCRVVR